MHSLAILQQRKRERMRVRLPIRSFYISLYQSAAIFIRRTDRLFGSLPAILSVCLAAIISTIIVKSTFMQNVCTLYINCL